MRRLSPPSIRNAIALRSRRSSVQSSFDDKFIILPVVDTSGSTISNGAGAQITKAISDITRLMLDCPELAETELGILGYGTSTSTEMFLPFSPVSEILKIPEIRPSMGTFIYEGYVRAISEIVARMQEIQQAEDRDIAGAWVIYLTDFQAMASDLCYAEQAFEARDRATEMGVNVFLVGAGSSVDVETASSLAQKDRPCIHISDVDFGLFFSWLLSTMRQKSMSGGRSIKTSFNGTELLID